MQPRPKKPLRLPHARALPNATTRKAIAQLETGKGKQFSSVGCLMAELRESD